MLEPSPRRYLEPLQPLRIFMTKYMKKDSCGFLYKKKYNFLVQAHLTDFKRCESVVAFTIEIRYFSKRMFICFVSWLVTAQLQIVFHKNLHRKDVILKLQKGSFLYTIELIYFTIGCRFPSRTDYSLINQLYTAHSTVICAVDSTEPNTTH